MWPFPAPIGSLPFRSSVPLSDDPSMRFPSLPRPSPPPFVIRNPQLAACPPLVVVAALEHHAGIAAAPRAHRLEPPERRHQHLRIALQQRGRQVLELQAIRVRERDGAFHHALQLSYVPRPPVCQQ